MASPRVPLMTVTPGIAIDKLAALMYTFPQKLFPVMKDNVQEVFTALKNVMATRSAEGPLYKRTGRLRRSWDSRSEGYNLRSFEMKTGSFSSYSIKHEVGGIFRPERQAKYFWIPLGLNLKANRTAKFSPKQALEFVRQKRWRAAKKTKGSADLAVSGKANMLLNEDGVPVYILVSSIKLKPQLHFQGTSTIFVNRGTERLGTLSAKLLGTEFAKVKH